MSALPALFVSHGAPTLAIADSPARRFLADYGREIGRPEAVVVLSAHHDEAPIGVTAAERPSTIHDFRGFPRELHEMQYPAPGTPALAREIVESLTAAGLEARPDPTRGLDHGAWVPLSLLYPQADVPVVQVAIDSRRGPAWHLALGEALGSLRDQGILVMASGSATHDLGSFAGQALDAPAPDWVTGFADWLAAAIETGRRDELLDYRARAPHAVRNHPTEEHLLPLFAALGAAGPDAAGRRIHASQTYGVLAMDVYAFA